jgi:hypothetical protein
MYWGIDIIKRYVPDPVQWRLPICKNLGTIGEKLEEKLENYIECNNSNLLNSEGKLR